MVLFPSDTQKPPTAERDTVAKATMASDSLNLIVPFRNIPTDPQAHAENSWFSRCGLRIDRCF